jgi:solute carrier family 25 protein 39/40
MSSEFQLNPLQKIAAATGGAALTALLTTPFDVLKTRAQIASYAQSSAASSSSSASSAASNVRIAALIRSEGIGALWRGLQPSLIMALPASGIYFPIYEYLREQSRRHLNADRSAPLIAGSAARVVTSAIVCPLEIARTNFQATARKETSTLSAYRALYGAVRRRGVSSLWTGLGPTLLRDVPFSAIYWGLYEVAKGSLRPHTDSEFAIAFGAGAFAGLVSAAATNPLDVVKSRRQAALVATNEAGTSWVIAQRIWQHEGWRGFCAGIGPRCAKVAPACAVMISTYEFIKAFLESRS